MKTQEWCVRTGPSGLLGALVAAGAALHRKGSATTKKAAGENGRANESVRRRTSEQKKSGMERERPAPDRGSPCMARGWGERQGREVKEIGSAAEDEAV